MWSYHHLVICSGSWQPCEYKLRVYFIWFDIIQHQKKWNVKREWITTNIKSYFLIFFHVVISYSYWCHDPRKKLSKSNARVFLCSILFKDADQVRYKSSYKKLGRGSNSSAGGLILGQRFKSSAESFKQDEAIIFINIMTLFICELDYFKDQIW